MKVIFAALCSILMLTVTTADASAAEKFPVETVKIVVPFPAGGTTDILARFVAQYLGERLKTTVIVENRSGAR